MKQNVILRLRNVSIDEVLKRKIVTFGGRGAHIIAPKKHIGKKVYIIIPRK